MTFLIAFLFLLLYSSYPMEDAGDSFRVSPRLPSFLPNVVLHLSPFSQVAGVKGIFLANKKVDDQVKTYITYNKGRDWRLLQAPDVDLRGSPMHCLLVSYHIPCGVPRAGCFPGDTASRCPSSVTSQELGLDAMLEEKACRLRSLHQLNGTLSGLHGFHLEQAMSYN